MKRALGLDASSDEGSTDRKAGGKHRAGKTGSWTPKVDRDADATGSKSDTTGGAGASTDSGKKDNGDSGKKQDTKKQDKKDNKKKDEGGKD